MTKGKESVLKDCQEQLKHAWLISYFHLIWWKSVFSLDKCPIPSVKEALCIGKVVWYYKWEEKKQSMEIVEDDLQITHKSALTQNLHPYKPLYEL